MSAIATSGGVLMAKGPKATLYVDIDLELKRRLDRLATHRGRKLTAEVARMVSRYLSEEEAKEEDLPPLPATDPPTRRKKGAP